MVSNETENLICAVSLTLVCILCQLIHIFIITRMFVRVRGRSPFALLCISRSFAHILSSTSMTLAMATPLYFDVEYFKYWLNVVTVPEISLYPSELFLASNRAIFVLFPGWYKRVFTRTITTIIISISWISGGIVLGDSLLKDCVLTFDRGNLMSHFSTDFCHDYNDMSKLIIIPCLAISGFLNAATLIYLLSMSRKVENPTVSELALDSGIRLFVYTFTVFLLWTSVQILWWRQIVDYIPTRVGKFFFNTMFSNGSHVVEGVLLIFCFLRNFGSRKISSMVPAE